MNNSNKMDTSLTGMWVSFFTAAGIPSDVSATYALTFAENRIQSDMLLDLNKEYLKDMGIVRMGDVIAILRHAKQVHETAARDKVLGAAGGGAGAGGAGSAARVPVAAVTGRATLAQPSSPASRILEHYTRNPPSPEGAAAGAVKLKRKASADNGTPTDMNIKKSRVIRFESPTRAAVPPKENGSSKTVFARLGNSEVAAAAPAAAAPAAKQIYLRLGSKGDGQPAPPAPPAPRASITPPVPVIQKDALKYEGILKASPPPKVATVTKKVLTVTAGSERGRRIAVATMRADEAPVSVRDKLALPRAKTVKFSSQVQYKEIEPLPPAAPAPRRFTPVFNKPERRLSMPPAAPAGVKARLGTKPTKNFTITKNVFNRLGA